MIDVTNTALLSLPAPVRRHLLDTGVVGSSVPEHATVYQEGRIRTRFRPERPDSGWMPFSAHQHFTIGPDGAGPPSFLWDAKVRMARVVPIHVVDSYQDGAGSLGVWLAPFLRVTNASGPRIDEAALQRYLGEMVWFPGAFASPLVSWTPVDHHSARASISDGSVTAECLFRFEPDSVVVEARRYREAPPFARIPWTATASRYLSYGKVLLPSRARVTWHLPEGAFTYFDATITRVEYDD